MTWPGSADCFRLRLCDLVWWPSAEHGVNAHHLGPGLTGWFPLQGQYTVHCATQQFPPSPVNKSNSPWNKTMVTEREREVGERELKSMRLGCLYILSYMSYLFILEMNPLSSASFANIFFHFEDCLFIYCDISGKEIQKRGIYMQTYSWFTLMYNRK